MPKILRRASHPRWPADRVRGLRSQRRSGRQPAPVRSFLLQTSILDSFGAELCDGLIEAEDSEWNARRSIDWIEAHNLFVTSLDSRREWYRYHQMFRSVLLERALVELGQERIGNLQRGAANWFAQRGSIDEAVSLALAAGDRDLASRCIVNGFHDALDRQDRATLDRWLRLFPDEFVRARPDLMLVRCGSLQISWQLSALGQELRHTLKAAGRAGFWLPWYRPRHAAWMCGRLAGDRRVLRR